METPSSPEQNEEMRRCALSGELVPLSALLCFVCDPAGNVVFDIKQNLPVEERLWLTGNRATVTRAVAEGVFARIGHAPADLPQRVEAQLQRRLGETLHLLRRSGALVGGFEKVKAAITSGKAVAVVQASDASEDGKAKLVKLAAHHDILVISPLTRAQLAEVTGQENQAHLALFYGGLTFRFIEDSRRFSDYIA